MAELGCAVGYVIERYQEVDFAVFVQTTSLLRLLLKRTDKSSQDSSTSPGARWIAWRNVTNYNAEKRHIHASLIPAYVCYTELSPGTAQYKKLRDHHGGSE